MVIPSQQGQLPFVRLLQERCPMELMSEVPTPCPSI